MTPWTYRHSGHYPRWDPRHLPCCPFQEEDLPRGGACLLGMQGCLEVCSEEGTSPMCLLVSLRVPMSMSQCVPQLVCICAYMHVHANDTGSVHIFQVCASPYEMKGIHNLFQDMMMSNCHTFQGEEIDIHGAQDHTAGSGNTVLRWKNAGPRHDLFLCCPLVVKKGLPPAAPPLPWSTNVGP